MKGGREHRVPLPARAVTILDEARGLGDQPGLVVSPGRSKRTPNGDTAIVQHLKRLGIRFVGVRVSFKSWDVGAGADEFAPEVCAAAPCTRRR